MTKLIDACADLAKAGHLDLARDLIHAAKGDSPPKEEGEVWRQIPDFPGYRASNKGRIWSDKQGKLLSPYLDKSSGYFGVNVTKDKRCLTQRVHTLVLRAWDRAPKKGEVGRHLDGNPANCAIKNLKWGTESENALDREAHSRQRAQEEAAT